MISIQQLGFYYKPDRPILQNVSFEIAKGDCVCLLGPNGTGKTTLIKCLLNYLKPVNGSVELRGKKIPAMSAKERAKHLAYVSQSTQLAFPYAVEEVVQMGRIAHMRLGASLSAKDKRIVEDVMEHLGIQHMAKNNFQTLSGGERQMVLVARALAQQAEYLILDEPTAALDYSNQIKILNVIRKLTAEGYGILMTTHFPDHAFLACNQAVLMRDGFVLEYGAPDKVVNSQNLTELYHAPVCVTDAAIKDAQHDTTQKVCIPILAGHATHSTQKETANSPL